MCYGIAKHTLQPLIENSIVHGIDFSSRDNRITIKGWKMGSDIYITICDNGKGMDEKRLEAIKMGLENASLHNKNSIGMSNVNQRIKLMYGNQYGISILSNKLEGTTVTVKIQAKSKEELEYNV